MSISHSSTNKTAYNLGGWCVGQATKWSKGSWNVFVFVCVLEIMTASALSRLNPKTCKTMCIHSSVFGFFPLNFQNNRTMVKVSFVLILSLFWQTARLSITANIWYEVRQSASTDETPDETGWVSSYLKLLVYSLLLAMITCDLWQPD